MECVADVPSARVEGVSPSRGMGILPMFAVFVRSRDGCDTRGQDARDTRRGTMQAEIIKTFEFDAAHCLEGVPEAHKCRRLHGHSYRVDVHVTGEVDPKVGWVMDFGDLKKIVAPVLEELDHRYLNDLPGLELCTAEMIAKYLFDRLKVGLPKLSAITVWESATARCVYRGQ